MSMADADTRTQMSGMTKAKVNLNPLWYPKCSCSGFSNSRTSDRVV